MGSVTLAWDSPVSGSPVASYKIYYGTASQSYSGSVSPGSSTKATLTGLFAGTTYYFVTTALDVQGHESLYSNEINFKIPSTNSPPFVSLTFPATAGAITAPFITNNGAIYQTTTTGLTNGGRAVYNFTIADAGDYTLSALVNGPNATSNSFYVNIDAEPTGAGMLWSFPLTTGFVNKTVSWPGLSAKVFTLSEGVHQLVIRGKDANTQLKSITLVPVLARLEITITAGKHVRLSGTGKPLHTYQVQATQNLISWTVLGNAVTDANGLFVFTDPTLASFASRSYRLRDPLP
jgi:hypothetical protein